MPPIDLGSYKSIYLKTAKEYINSMLVSLDQLLVDVTNKEALNNLHIASHSLKSQSQVMEFSGIADICLGVEKMSDNALKGIIQLNSENILNIKKKVEELSGIFLRQLADQDDNAAV